MRIAPPLALLQNTGCARKCKALQERGLTKPVVNKTDIHVTYLKVELDVLLRGKFRPIVAMVDDHVVDAGRGRAAA